MMSVSSSRPIWPARMASMRVHRRGQSACGRSKWRPRLSRVIWRTCLPSRSEATSRWVEYDSLVDSFRVAVLRIKMPRPLGRAGGRRPRGTKRLLDYKEKLGGDVCNINQLKLFCYGKIVLGLYKLV